MFSIMKGISITARCAELYRNQKLGDLGLWGNHYAYVLNLCRTPGISQEQLSKLLCINKSNVARQLAVLEEAGYVLRTPSPEDKRIILLYPTQKAQEALPQIRQTLREWSKYVTQDFTEEERELLSSMLEKITLRSTAYIEQAKESR